MNENYGFSETWLKHYDDENLWHLQMKIFITFWVDRNSSQKSRGGVLKLVILETLIQENEMTSNHMNQDFCESVWIECNSSGNNSRIKQ